MQKSIPFKNFLPVIFYIFPTLCFCQTNLKDIKTENKKNTEIIYETNLSSISPKIKKQGELVVKNVREYNTIDKETRIEPVKELNNLSHLNSQKENMLYLTGEPVPDDEIYVELEPDNEPIINLPDSAGYEICEIPISPNINFNNYNFIISPNLNEKCFINFSKNNKKFISKGYYIYALETIVNQKKYFSKFIVKSIQKDKNCNQIISNWVFLFCKIND